MKVYTHDGRPRVAAIWESRETGARTTRAERVGHRSSWAGVRKLDRALQRDGYHLSAIEVFRHHGGHRIAGLWRFGTGDGKLQEALTCEGDSVLLRDERSFRRCGLTAALEAMHQQGWQAVDIERYEAGDQTRYAVLYQRRQGVDWLQLPTTAGLIRRRQQELNGAEGSSRSRLTEAGFELADMDILDFWLQRVGETPTHLGLVHDAGTSGPPPDNPP